MKKNDYNVLCKTLGISSSWNSYNQCRTNYNVYLNFAKSICLNAEKVVFIFLESCPLNISNYIFSNVTRPITSKNDSYLWNIYSGFYNKRPYGKNKIDCLTELLKYTTKSGTQIPVIIFDLFPFHGIKLNSNNRHSISKNISNPFLLKDVLNDITFFNKCKKRLFLFGVPYTIWNNLGGFGTGSIYLDTLKRKTGLLGSFHNISVVINVGGQNINSTRIIDWRNQENIS